MHHLNTLESCSHGFTNVVSTAVRVGEWGRWEGGPLIPELSEVLGMLAVGKLDLQLLHNFFLCRYELDTQEKEQ